MAGHSRTVIQWNSSVEVEDYSEQLHGSQDEPGGGTGSNVLPENWLHTYLVHLFVICSSLFLFASLTSLPPRRSPVCLHVSSASLASTFPTRIPSVLVMLQVMQLSSHLQRKCCLRSSHLVQTSQVKFQSVSKVIISAQPCTESLSLKCSQLTDNDNSQHLWIRWKKPVF